jgi:tripartite-type tricarboxylate transporter receptor subunit TctC
MARKRKAVLIGNAIAVWAVAVMVLHTSQPVEAQTTWPTKPIRLLVPYPAGGIVDIVARAVAEPMSAELGRPVVVDPRPGANGTLAASMIPQATADGYSWLILGSIHVVAPHLQVVPYDAVNDFQGVAMIATCAQVVAVNPSLPVENLKELVEYGRANPAKIYYLNPGNGSPPHLSAELLKIQGKFNMIAVPYRGVPPGMADLIEGRLQMGILPLALALQHVQSGKLRAVAVAGDKPNKALPGVPTFVQQGFGDAQSLGWMSIAVRAGTPAGIVGRINQAAVKMAAAPSTGDRFDKASCEGTAARTPAEVQAFYAQEFARYGELIKEAGISGDK